MGNDPRAIKDNRLSDKDCTGTKQHSNTELTRRTKHVESKRVTDDEFPDHHHHQEEEAIHQELVPTHLPTHHQNNHSIHHKFIHDHCCSVSSNCVFFCPP